MFTVDGMKHTHHTTTQIKMNVQNVVWWVCLCQGVDPHPARTFIYIFNPFTRLFRVYFEFLYLSISQSHTVISAVMSCEVLLVARQRRTSFLHTKRIGWYRLNTASLVGFHTFKRSLCLLLSTFGLQRTILSPGTQ